MSDTDKSIREWLIETYSDSSLTYNDAAELENIIKNAVKAKK